MGASSLLDLLARLPESSAQNKLQCNCKVVHRTTMHSSGSQQHECFGFVWLARWSFLLPIIGVISICFVINSAQIERDFNFTAAFAIMHRLARRAGDTSPSNIETMSSQEEKAKNPMRQLKIDKMIINCCVGESGDRLTRAAKVLEQLTDKKPVYSKGTAVDHFKAHLIASFI